MLRPSRWLDAVAWHVRGLFASEANRTLAFGMRALWQPAEFEARRGLGRDLAAEVDPELRLDPRTGYRVLSSLPAVHEVCEIGKSIIRVSSLADGQANTEKKFSRFRIATTDERLALLRVALDRRVLAMAAAHLGGLPVITEADYFCSFPVEGRFTKSQLWHCDDDAGDVMKLFIYCDDVAMSDGPFEVIDSDVSRRVRAEIGYRYAGRRYRVADEVMERHVPVTAQRAIVGTAGTAFAVDTARCFHRGSRITDKTRRRVMATICYCPANAMTVPRQLARHKAPLAQLAEHFSEPIERAALGMPVAAKWV